LICCGPTGVGSFVPNKVESSIARCDLIHSGENSASFLCRRRPQNARDGAKFDDFHRSALTKCSVPAGYRCKPGRLLLALNRHPTKVLSEQSGHGHCCERSANDPQWTIRPCQALLRADQTMHASCGLCPSVLHRDLNKPNSAPTPSQRASRHAGRTSNSRSRSDP